MTALSERKIDIVRTLVEAAPDKVVGGLQAALADTGGDSVLSAIRRLVEAEAADRRLRNHTLAPLAPLCVGDGANAPHLAFPSAVIGLLWRGLKATASREVAVAARLLAEHPLDLLPGEPFDQLTKIAAYGLRRREPAAFRTAAELSDAAWDGGADQLAACLDLAPVVRQASLRLPEWLAHFGEETTAAARLAYKDAVTIADDAGPRFFEMLAAQMQHPWMVLRVISAVMDKPTERYLAGSEMAGFGERVLQDIDAALDAISHMDMDGGIESARTAGRLVEAITLQTSEVEACVDLVRDHGWGARLAKQRKALASVVESRLRDASKYVDLALPTQPAKLRRIRRSLPRLTLPPDAKAVQRAITLLAFAEEIRSSANYGGFASARSQLLEKTGEFLDHYVEEVLDLLRTGDAESETIAVAMLGVAADFSQLVRGDKAAELVRRRTAVAAGHAEPQPLADA